MQIVPISPEGYNLLHDGAIAFSDMQQRGIKVDLKHCKNEYRRLGKEVKNHSERLESYEEIKKWKRLFGKKFNLDSDEQLQYLLFNYFGYEPQKLTENGNPSVDSESLSALEIPVADELLRYRKLEKIRNTYLRSLIKETCNGYLHPFLNLHGPRTFRSSSSNPNIQNQPTRDPEAGEVIRKAFRAREGHRLVAADYGGIEVKGSSWYHKDPTMLGYLNDPENADMHADFCKLLFRLESLDQSNKGEKTLRKATKNGFTFPQFYGDYYGNNAVSLWGWLGLRGHKISSKQGVKIRDDVPIGKHLRNKGIKNFEQFKEHVRKIEEDMWSNRFPVYKQWRDNQWEWYQENGYVTILSGFVCQGIMTRNAVINYPIQGVCFHCLLWSIIQINEIIKKENMRTKPIFQVHDEIVSDVPDDEYDEYVDILKEVMCKQLKKHWPWINTKLELEVERSDVGGNWHEMEKSLEYIH